MVGRSTWWWWSRSIGIGACFVSGRVRLLRIGVVAGIVICLADWVLVQDFGFFGGVGTDPNSMIPMALVFVAGYLAVVRPVPAEGASAGRCLAEAPVRPPRRPATSGGSARPTRARSLAAIGAVGIVLLGTAPMAAGRHQPQRRPHRDRGHRRDAQRRRLPGAPVHPHRPGRAPGVASARSPATPWCSPSSTRCAPPTARSSPRSSGRPTRCSAPRPSGVDLVAVVTNPVYDTAALTTAFDQQEGLDHLPNWIYLTGSLAQLHKVWNDYGVQAAVAPAGAMVAHTDIVYVIDRTGRTRAILNADPGTGAQPAVSSFSALLAGQVRTVQS